MSFLKRLQPVSSALFAVKTTSGQFGCVANCSNSAFNFVVCRSRLSSRTIKTSGLSQWFLTSGIIKMASTVSAAVKAKLDQIADVKIDETGRFKYILIKVYVKDEAGQDVDSNSKIVVRGRADCPYHGDIFDKFQEETSRLEGFDDDILGGGRIERTGNKISVFGYSQGYGKADHALTVEILKKQYPTHNITWSDEGY